MEKALKDLKAWAEGRGVGILAKPVCACFSRLHNPGPLHGSVLIWLNQSLGVRGRAIGGGGNWSTWSPGTDISTIF